MRASRGQGRRLIPKPDTSSTSLGFGLGLRTCHYEHVVTTRPAVDWFEVISENFFVEGGKPRHYLRAVRDHYPVVLHGVSMSIGSTDPLDYDYLAALKTLVLEVEPAFVSDHLCWTSVGGVNSHDLLPLPYTPESLDHVVARVGAVQDYLGRSILLENVSTYVAYEQDCMPEWEFLNRVARRSGCGVLLDVNNVYVSARNGGFDPSDYLDAVDTHHVRQFHMAGHSDYGSHVVDTHDHDVRPEVMDLYVQAVQRFGMVNTLLERDDRIPDFETLFAELQTIRRRADEALTRR